jgi:phosphoribosyl-AMP cyclohydrolase
MVAHMDRDAYTATLATGRATFWSRSRQRLWEKGETSGNVMHVVEARLDCDGDAVLLLVEPAGPACHTGAATCFTAPPAGIAAIEGDGER